MSDDFLASADSVIKHLFNPSYNNKFIPLQGKYLYLKHYLDSKWTEICGSNLATKCRIDKLVGNELYIVTANSLLANELYMMQHLFLQKINAFLLGSLVIKKLYFHSGSYIQHKKSLQLKPEKPPIIEFTTCPKCGARMEKGLSICSVCERAEREALRADLAELLRIQPWLTYEDCLVYYKCDRIMFTAVKDSLKNYYFERVRLGYADKKESILAVLFLTGKKPEDINAAIYNNAITYLRR